MFQKKSVKKTSSNVGTRTDKLKVISAKDLGKLNMPDFCPRCFWLERQIGKPPMIFPGIFSVIDSVTKKGVARCFEEKGILPQWLPIPNVAEIIEEDIFFKMPAEYDWILVGKPDDIFRLEDDSYHIVDYKTARFTERQDELLPIYEVQLNSYAFLAQEYGWAPVKKLSLVYCEPNGELEREEDFSLKFSTHILEIDLNLDIVRLMLERARAILNLSEPPPAHFSCRGICRWLAKFVIKYE